MNSIDPTNRFSDRVQAYVKYRPSYPPELTKSLATNFAIDASTVVADVGSGTGISTDIFLELGCETFAIEPNSDMRAAAEVRHGTNPRFRSISGSAEATTLANNSVDCVAAAQAFHWFDVAPTRTEFRRILRAEGIVALFWNVRLTDTSEFLEGYEQLLLDFATDYQQVDHRRVGDQQLAEFFGGPFRTYTFPNAQVFDFPSLQGRLLSSSYAPNEGHPNHAPMLAQLKKLFAAHAEQGSVRFEYNTELHVGTLSGEH